MEELGTTNMFHHGPIREAMMIYLSKTYEENAQYDEYTMEQEYSMLLRENRLNEIFMAVQLNNYEQAQLS